MPHPETLPTARDSVLAKRLFHNTRGYLEKVVFQINTTYDNTCYDACAVMIRRLVETLIIDAFEYRGIADSIKSANGEFLPLDELVDKTVSERGWNLRRDTKQELKKLKHIGDLSAHGRRYNAQRHDIDGHIAGLRVVAEELLYLSGFKQ